jgi:hypothetical protein
MVLSVRLSKQQTREPANPARGNDEATRTIGPGGCPLLVTGSAKGTGEVGSFHSDHVPRAPDPVRLAPMLPMLCGPCEL